MLIEVIPYQTEWPNQFFDVACKLREGLRNNALRIDHIGSTAVPGLSAKPIIDVQLTVASLDIEAMLTQRLAPLGLLERRENREDRPPTWEIADQKEWRKLYYRTPDGRNPRIHLHVREMGRRNQRYGLLFRDFLKASRGTRDAYGKFKQNLARTVGHLSSPGGTGLYLEMKDPVLDLIAEAAERWAEMTSWHPGPSDA